MSDADKRTVHTDALETLGTILTTDEHRDAIHLGVEPAITGQVLRPGTDVGFLEDGRIGTGPKVKKVGIVDPFLPKKSIPANSKVWLVVYPRQITSLRHVWTHPDFADTKDLVSDGPSPKDLAEAQLTEWAESIGSDLEEVVRHAGYYLGHDEYWIDGGRWEGMSPPRWFWSAYAAYTGAQLPLRLINDKHDGNFFSCSC